MPSERVRSDYDARFADAYDAIFADRAGAEAVATFLATRFADGTALELGVGTGRIALPLAERGVAVVGIDDSVDMLARLRSKLAAHRGARIEPIQTDMRYLPDGIAVDGVYSVLGSLACLPTSADREQVFAAARRVVPAGALFVAELFTPAVIRSMHPALDTPVSVQTRGSDGRSTLSSMYELTEGGTRWRASHEWVSGPRRHVFHESVALVEPAALAAEAAAGWRPVELLRDWTGAPMHDAPGPMMIAVFEAKEDTTP
jgi:SAM-dependent methyltransferase